MGQIFHSEKPHHVAQHRDPGSPVIAQLFCRNTTSSPLQTGGWIDISIVIAGLLA
jgi:hypothetical protein